MGTTCKESQSITTIKSHQDYNYKKKIIIIIMITICNLSLLSNVIIMTVLVRMNIEPTGIGIKFHLQMNQHLLRYFFTSNAILIALKNLI